MIKSTLLHALITLTAGVLSATLAAAILAIIGFAVLQAQYRHDLGSKESVLHLTDRGVILYDRSDQPFFRFYDAQYRKIVPLDHIAPAVIDALIASEDDSFYRHHGYSVESIVRASWQNWRAGSIVSGGSTITQQLARTLYLSPEQSYWRKLQELLISMQLERQFEKRDILELYLNTAYFGAGTYGIEAAAQGYFNTSAQELSYAQASLLVAMLQAPSALSPITNGPEPAKREQEQVLQRMRLHSVINDEQYTEATGEELHYSSLEEVPLYPSKAPHFAFLVLDELKRQYGEEALKRSGFHVKTSLDLTWQQHTEEALRQQVDSLRLQGANNAGAIVLDPRSSEIRALVGSTDWNGGNAGKFNVVTAHRQPGSSFKPILYATALEQKVITAATVLKDRSTTYRGAPGSEAYTPRNFDGRFRGNVPVRRALANSLNVPAVQVLSLLGIDPFLDSAQAFGYTSLEDRSRFGLSLALGSGEVSLLEHAGAYAVLARGGEYRAPTTITQIKGPTGQLEQRPVPPSRRVVSAETAYIVSSILSDQQTRSEVFGRSLDLGRPVAVKTGTTQDYIDAWTMGYTPDLVVGVWVGRNDSTPMQRIAGIRGAAPLWRTLMEEFMDKNQPWYEPPASLVAVDVCRSNGQRATFTSSREVYTEYFAAGSEPTSRCGLVPVEEEQTPSDDPNAPKPEKLRVQVLGADSKKKDAQPAEN